MERECNVSAECNVNTDTVKFCYQEVSFTEETFFCDCENWYGWRGEDCEEVSPFLIYGRVKVISVTFFSFFLLLALTRTLYFHVRFGFRPKNEYDSTFYSAIFAWLAVFFLLIHHVVQIPGLYDPQHFEIFEFVDPFSNKEEERILIKHSIIANIAIFYVWIFLALTVVAAVFSWVKIILTVLQQAESQALLRKWRRRFKYCAIVTILWMVIFSHPALVLVAFSFFGMSNGLLVLGYLYCNYLFLKTLRSIEIIENEQVAHITSVIKRTTRVLSIFLPLASMFTVAFILLYPITLKSVEPGSFNLTPLLGDLVIFFISVNLTVLAWYVNSLLDRRYKLRNFSSFNLWAWWDASNDKIIETEIKHSNQITHETKQEAVHE